MFQNLSDSVIINNWLGMTEDDALNSIEAQVRSSSTEDVDRLAATLLAAATHQFDPEVRERLIRFYGFFKIVEFHRYGQWRGFP